MNDAFLSRCGLWALIAGASQGLGRAFAKELASRGLNLVLIARRKRLLQVLAKEVKKISSIQIRVVSLDLNNQEKLEQLPALMQDIEVGLVVYNAAFPNIGPFHRRTLADHRRVVAVNCMGPVFFCHQFGIRMKKRGRGGIILMSSLAGFTGTSLLSHYAASKAYIRILAEGLWCELKADGVAVLVCCPGAVDTPNFRNSIPNSKNISRIPVMRPEKVVRKALGALGKKSILIPGFLNKLNYFLTIKIIPRKFGVAFLNSITQKLYRRLK
jgi:short-subunit dehydrogenase